MCCLLRCSSGAPGAPGLAASRGLSLGPLLLAAPQEAQRRTGERDVLSDLLLHVSPVVFSEELSLVHKEDECGWAHRCLQPGEKGTEDKS